MARSHNQITLVGRVGGEPERRTLRNGMAKVEVSVATNRTRGGEEHTDWFNCQFWDKLADLAENLLSKGDLVYISGRMESSKYTDKEGNNRTRWEVSVNTFVPMARDKQQEASSGGSYYSGGAYGGKPAPSKPKSNDDWLDGGDDNIPF